MICKTDYFRLAFSKKDQDGNTITRCYSLPIDLNFENHYVCFIKKLMEDRVVIANDHLKDIGTRYANAIVKKMEELVPW
jgi:hypothetical protein